MIKKISTLKSLNINSINHKNALKKEARIKKVNIMYKVMHFSICSRTFICWFLRIRNKCE